MAADAVAGRAGNRGPSSSSGPTRVKEVRAETEGPGHRCDTYGRVGPAAMETTLGAAESGRER
jgi:hypothetical protein